MSVGTTAIYYFWPDRQINAHVGIAKIFITDYIESGCVTAETVHAQLLAQFPFESIDCTITSGGGDYLEGFEIYNLLRGFGVPVTTRVPDFCASIATVIFLAGETRLVAPGLDRGLIHNPWSGIEGDYYQMMQYADEVLKPVMEELITFYTKNTRLNKATLDTLMRVDTTLSGEQMVAMGFATALYNPNDSPTTPTPAARRKINARATITPKNKTNIDMQVNSLLGSTIKALQALVSGSTIKALDIPLSDGTTLVTTSAGEIPLLNDPATIGGNPAPDGEYVSADGVYLITVANGLVLTVTDASEDQPVEDAAPAASVELTEVEQLRAENEILREQVTQVQTAQASVLARVNAVLGTMQSPDVNTKTLRDIKPVSARTDDVPTEESIRREMLARRAKRGQVA